MSQSMPTFPDSRRIIMSELSKAEQEQLMDFLVENDVHFFKHVIPAGSSGRGSAKRVMHLANIRMYDEEVYQEIQEQKREEEGRLKKTQERTRRQRTKKSHAEDLFLNAVGVSSHTAVDYSPYSKFCTLLSSKTSVRPRRKPLTWVMRQVEEIYDSRYARNAVELQEESSSERVSTIFPVFVFDFFSKRYGLPQLVDQNCWDLLYNVHLLREDHLEVDIFAHFLEEYYEPDDLLFFLYVRSVVQKTLNVARTLFGSETDPLYRTFMGMLERSMTGEKYGREDKRKIEVTQFLNVAVVEYHETRPTEAAVTTPKQSAGLSASRPIIQSREEQERLYREAVENYEKSMMEGGGDSGRLGVSDLDHSTSSGGGRMNLSDMESKHSPPRSAASSTRGGRSAGSTPTRSSAPSSSSKPLAPSRPLLEALGRAMLNANNKYLHVLTKSASSLPEGIQQQIREEVSAQLEKKVDAILGAVISGRSITDLQKPLQGDLAQLADRFRDLVAEFEEEGSVESSRMDEFARKVLQTSDLRQEVEPLVALLVTYATARLHEVEEDEEEEGGGGRRD